MGRAWYLTSKHKIKLLSSSFATWHIYTLIVCIGFKWIFSFVFYSFFFLFFFFFCFLGSFLQNLLYCSFIDFFSSLNIFSFPQFFAFRKLFIGLLATFVFLSKFLNIEKNYSNCCRKISSSKDARIIYGLKTSINLYNLFMFFIDKFIYK